MCSPWGDGISADRAFRDVSTAPKQGPRGLERGPHWGWDGAPPAHRGRLGSEERGEGRRGPRVGLHQLVSGGREDPEGRLGRRSLRPGGWKPRGPAGRAALRAKFKKGWRSRCRSGNVEPTCAEQAGAGVGGDQLGGHSAAGEGATLRCQQLTGKCGAREGRTGAAGPGACSSEREATAAAGRLEGPRVRGRGAAGRGGLGQPRAARAAAERAPGPHWETGDSGGRARLTR